MAKLGLGAYVETSGAEVRPLDARRWRRATIALLAVLLFQLQFLAIAFAWDTPQRTTVVAIFVILWALAAAGAGFMYYEYIRRRHVEREKLLASTELAAQQHAAAEAPHPLEPHHLWLLLPVAMLALLKPQVTLRVGLAAWTAWRNAQDQTRSKE